MIIKQTRIIKERKKEGSRIKNKSEQEWSNYQSRSINQTRMMIMEQTTIKKQTWKWENKKERKKG
jgi:hypothetical protein